jgi:hypothetical protein
MKARHWVPGPGVLLLAAAPATAETNLEITAFNGGYLSWTNVDPSLYYTVQWRPDLAGAADWSGSYRGCQDLKSPDPAITVPVPVYYRVVGSSTRSTFAAPVVKTGQTPTAPYEALGGSDGTLQKGEEWPNPRFTTGTGVASNCVLDNLTGLMWLRNPEPVAQNWYDALFACMQLDGAEGRGNYDDWRMPNVNEQLSIIAWRYDNLAVPDAAGTGQWTEGDPFQGLRGNWYWASTTVAANNDYAWAVSLYNGYVYNYILKSAASAYVWPVRGGK